MFAMRDSYINANVIGQRFGHLTVKKLDSVIGEGKYKKYRFVCECDCGNTVVRDYATLRRNKDIHCGCLALPKNREYVKTGPADPNKYVGLRLGNVTGTNEWKYVAANIKHPVEVIKFKFNCDCGGEIWYAANQINTYIKQKEAGKTIYCNCGCKRGEVASMAAKCFEREYNMNSGKYLHRFWSEMIYRCNSPAHQQYKNYGAKGIQVCDEWYDPHNRPASYTRFANWAYKNGYVDDKDMIISRKDSNGDYTPENCYVTNNRTASFRQFVKRGIEIDGELYSFNELDIKYDVYLGKTLRLMIQGCSADTTLYLLAHPDCKIDDKGQIVDADGFTRLVRKTGAKYILN